MSKAILYDSTLCIGCKAAKAPVPSVGACRTTTKSRPKKRISAHKLTTIETHGEQFHAAGCA